MAKLLSMLSLGYVALAVVSYVLLGFLHQIIHYRFFHPLNKFPGPFWGGVTRLWLTYHNVRGREVEVCEELHKKHGPIVRITPTMLLIDDADKLPFIYHRAANKSAHYITGAAGKTESLFNMQDHHMHARHRKIAAAPYTFTSIKKMEPLIDAQISHWLSRMDSLFAAPDVVAENEKDRIFDLCPWLVYMGYDVVSEIGFGAPFGFVDEGRDVGGLIQGMHDGLLPFGIMARMHPFSTWIKNTWFGEKYLVARPEHKNGFGAMMRYRDKLVAQRFKDIEEGKNIRFDLLQTFIDARDENGEPLSVDYIKAEVLIVLIAGADTTGTAFQALVKYILTNPSIYTKLMAEIDAVTRDNKVSGPVPAYEEIVANYPYLVACVQEALRLTPSAPSIFPRLVSKGGLELDGKFVPEGLEVTANPYLVNRDPKVYGDDAQEYRPERWLESEEKTRLYGKSSFTFGYGSRVCLGQHVAMMEMYKAPLLFFRSFAVTLCNPEHPATYHVRGGVAWFENMQVTMKRREPMAE